MEHQSLINELIIILAASVGAAALFNRLRVPTIVCYLIVGALLGPGLGLVTSIDQFQIIAEFGVAFLLFTLGLEFSLPRLVALRRVVFGMGSLQMLVCIAVFGLLIYWTRHIYNLSFTGILIIASAIALSSTAIVSKELSLRNEIATAHGHMAIGVLLFQDIAAIFILVLISVGGDLNGAQLTASLGAAALKALAFFVTVLAIGKWVLPPLFTEIAKAKSEELFVLTVLVVALLAAAAAHGLGLAMALGAFMAGMMLGESHFRHQIEAEIRPFRDVLLGIFFVSIGLIIDIDLIVTYWPRILLFALCLIVFKSLVIAMLCKFFGSEDVASLRTGLILCQGGEFGFALLALAVKDLLIPADVASFFLSIIIISMAMTPFLVSNSRTIANFLLRRSGHGGANAETDFTQDSRGFRHHVILCGYGRVGQTLARFLVQENIPYVAVDDDPVLVERAQALGEPVYFGNARKIKILQQMGLDNANLVVVSFDDPQLARGLVHEIRTLRKSMPILVRTRDDSYLLELQRAGATEVIPETLEASLMMVSHVMAALGLPAQKVFNAVGQVRKQRYQMLHGFIQGQQQPFGFLESSGQVEPLFLPEAAHAVGKTLANFDLNKMGVVIPAIRRDGKTLRNPSDDTLLLAKDILILSGEQSAIEAAEGLFLSGK